MRSIRTSQSQSLHMGLHSPTGAEPEGAIAMTMTDVRAKALHLRFQRNHQDLTMRQCRQLDEYIRTFALERLKHKLPPKPFAGFVMLMARCHFGSVEVDALLTELDCYPKWLGAKP